MDFSPSARPFSNKNISIINQLFEGCHFEKFIDSVHRVTRDAIIDKGRAAKIDGSEKLRTFESVKSVRQFGS
jgi:hypothetical protein